MRPKYLVVSFEWFMSFQRHDEWGVVSFEGFLSFQRHDEWGCCGHGKKNLLFLLVL
jgi:hypothetical protein